MWGGSQSCGGGDPRNRRLPEGAVVEGSQGYAVLLGEMKGLAPLDQEAQDSQSTRLPEHPSAPPGHRQEVDVGGLW